MEQARAQSLNRNRNFRTGTVTMGVDMFNVARGKSFQSKCCGICDYSLSDRLNKSLAVYKLILDDKLPRKKIEKIVEIICKVDFDANLFRLQVVFYSGSLKIAEEIVEPCRHKWDRTGTIYGLTKALCVIQLLCSIGIENMHVCNIIS